MHHGDKIQILTYLRLFHANLVHHHVHALIICAWRSGVQRCSGAAIVCGVTAVISLVIALRPLARYKIHLPENGPALVTSPPPTGAKCDDVTLERIKKLAQHFGARYLSPVMMVGQSIGGEKRVHQTRRMLCDGRQMGGRLRWTGCEVCN